jgi:hypothetical protein
MCHIINQFLSTPPLRLLLILLPHGTPAESFFLSFVSLADGMVQQRAYPDTGWPTGSRPACSKDASPPMWGTKHPAITTCHFVQPAGEYHNSYLDYRYECTTVVLDFRVVSL